MDPGNWPRLWKLGGMVFPGHSGTDSYVKDWRDYRPRETPYDFGWGYGADLGGLSHQPDKSAKGSITYPFKSYDGKVTFQRQKTGDRTFDFTKEGVAHYGLYADWLADLRRVGGQKLADDMWAGAEAYLEMWERTSGIETKPCSVRHARVKPYGFRGIRLGYDWRTLLKRAGQPQQRDRAWSWCVKGRYNGRKADVAVLSTAGTVDLVGSTALDRLAFGVGVGDPASAVRGARSLGGGLLVRSKGNSTYAFATRSGRVRAVAVTTARFAAHRAGLRDAMRRVLTARASSRKRRFIPAKAQAKGRMLGRALAETSSPPFAANGALYCSLNL
jgi:hypothetical protein